MGVLTWDGETLRTTDLEPGTHHAVDDFIDVDLRRHEPSWTGWDLPAELFAAEGFVEATSEHLEPLIGLLGHMDDRMESSPNLPPQR